MEVTQAKPTIFVVDDNASVREAIKSLLESTGLQTETFESAQDFLRHKLPDGPKCLVLDVLLPGLGGLDFQNELTRANIRIPIIFITGHGDIPMTVRAMKAGAVEFLTKPFRDEDLLAAIQQAFDVACATRKQQSEILAAWVWGSRSAARLSRPMADGYGQRRTSPTALSFGSHCRLRATGPHDLRGRHCTRCSA
jgi:FixJ family two-component response regulator